MEVAIQNGRTLYHLVATGRAGDGLYQFTNYRSGGRDYLIVNPDGSRRNGNAYNASRGPKPPTTGRWAWTKEG